jgi:cell division protein FtsN
MGKIKRFSKAMWAESVKRLPYIAALLVILLLFGAVQSYRKTAEGVRIASGNSEIIKKQSEIIKQQGKDIKALSEQNNSLAKENAAHIDCIAKLFASYINNGGLVSGADLNNCQTILTKSGSTSQTTPATSSGASQQSSQTSSSPKSKPKKNPPKSNNVQKHNPKQVFGVPVCLPDPLSFIDNGLCVTD